MCSNNINCFISEVKNLWVFLSSEVPSYKCTFTWFWNALFLKQRHFNAFALKGHKCRTNNIKLNVHLISKVELYSVTLQCTLISTDATNATKLFVTLRIRNVTLADDSQYGRLGRYECHAYAVNETDPQRHGFSVNVIRRECFLFHVIITLFYSGINFADNYYCTEFCLACFLCIMI